MLLTDQVAQLLKSARVALGLTQKELAIRAGVSQRLWAELERGERPNVSLATALRMLGEVGVTVRLTDPLGRTRELRDARSSAAGLAARAAVRRATWVGRQLRLDQEGKSDPAARTGVDRVAAVARVSEQAFAIAHARRSSKRRPKAQPSARKSAPTLDESAAVVRRS